ncbi:recombinase family protein [Rhizobium sp. RAF56]|uniref:recombinase family protein n=1 Tax=Rhizobium sp. RAF56 TaxID=3233062 RepID=UPI003F94B91C
MSSVQKLRCAVYTRKSSEEGLDQAFNSLDAQREACVAFIRSQASLGWRIVADPYDDGGISGGTMERPALKRLLQHIRERRIDVIVVYKIDRLTRSLMDFARMVEIFDQHSVSFVSVTQQFNTTTSMGRLTLNVLLSFAQFEREVTAERIRDKVAASKKKGMWMGGPVPLGYKAVDRKLAIDPEAAGIVGKIFDCYLELRSVPALIEQWPSDGAMGLPPSRGKLYHLLSNPIYIGKVRHKGVVHDGEQPPLVDAETFDRVQELLAEQAQSPKVKAVSQDGGSGLLTGLLFDADGCRLTPVHASSHGKRYRYYVSDHRNRNQTIKSRGLRIPTNHLEETVELKLQQLLGDGSRLMPLIDAYPVASDVMATLGAARRLSQHLPTLSHPEKRSLMRSVFRRIVLGDKMLVIELDGAGLMQIITDHACERGLDNRCDSHPTASMNDAPAIVLNFPLAFKTRGVESRIVVDGRSPSQVDKTLVDGIALAHACLKALTDGSSKGISEVAADRCMDASDVSRILPLAFLALLICAES